MPKHKSEPPRGVLNQKSGADNFGLSRFYPSKNLSFFIEHYWIVKWDLRDQEPFEQDVLSHPSVQLVFEKKNTWIWGVVTGKFTRRLEGKGKVAGIKFRPGAFYPFYQESVSDFTDDILAFSKVFDEDLHSIESDILDQNIDEQMAEKAESFLLRHLPNKDSNIATINKIIQEVMNESTILKVDDLTDRFELSKRTLQRMFKKYVGVTPKWVIQRYRLHEAAEMLASEQTANWPQIALELGYYDQSHFIRDFKNIVGKTPSDYVSGLQR